MKRSGTQRHTKNTMPKPKASARRTRSGSDTSITPPTAIVTPRPTDAATSRLTAAVKGKQTTKAPKAKSLSAPSEVAMIEAEQLKLVLKGSRQQMHISQPGGSGTDKGTGSKPWVPDVPTDELKKELSWNYTNDEGEEDDDDENKDGDAKDDADEDQEAAKHDDKDDTEESGDDDEEDSKDEDDGEEEDELYQDQESSSVSSQFVTSMLNPTIDVGMESIFETTSRIDVQTPTSVAPLPMTIPTMTSSTIATTTTTSQAPIPPKPIPSEVLRNLPTFTSVFCFDDRLRTVDENIKKIIKEQVKEQVKAQVSKILPRIEQVVNEQLEAKVLTRSSHSSRTSYPVADDLSEMEVKKILIKKMEGNKSIQHSDAQRNLYKALVDAYESNKIILDTYEETVTLKRRRDDDEEPSARPDQGTKRRKEGKEPESASTPSETTTKSAGRLPLRWKNPPIWSLKQKPPSPDRDWNKTLPAVYGSIQPWISKLAKQADTRSSFNELMDTPLDFSNFIMNRFRVDTLTPELLAGPTYDLVKGSCKSLIELEYHLEEVYKAITDQLDWVPLAASILHQLQRRAADYGHIKWIEDLVPRTMWIQEPIDYDMYALWGVSH
nr:hypothetical protein [Tanacetum cinerariifolium]